MPDQQALCGILLLSSWWDRSPRRASYTLPADGRQPAVCDSPPRSRPPPDVPCPAPRWCGQGSHSGDQSAQDCPVIADPAVRERLSSLGNRELFRTCARLGQRAGGEDEEAAPRSLI